MTTEARAEEEAIGVSRGGRTTKIHAITDEKGRIRRFDLTGGNRHDAAVAEPLILGGDSDVEFMIGDKGYDSKELRNAAIDAGMTPVIPSREGAVTPADYDVELYKERNFIERAFCRIKDYRRIATRYDKLKRNFDAAVALVSVRMWFLI